MVHKIIDDVVGFISKDSSDSTNDLYIIVIDLQSKIYTDQTSRFPVTSNLGKNAS